jgi:hypothetical protein
MEATLISSLLVSAVAVMIMIGPAVADFNATHATNPLWTPHARFHVVWQVFTNSTVAALSLYLLWVVDAFWLAAFLNAVWFGSFFLTLAVMSRFEGALADVNGIKPFIWRFGGREVKVDTNLFGACLMTVLNTSAMVLR